MNGFFPEEDSALARQELEKLKVDIDVLNDQKRGWQKAWEGEVARTGDQTLEKPPELRALNKQLGPLYGRREDLLRRFPHLEAEYGGKKRTQQAAPTLTVFNSATKRERAERKRANHERNLARRREEDRARARGGRGGGGKKA
jgi:hypothetical protein